MRTKLVHLSAIDTMHRQEVVVLRPDDDEIAHWLAMMKVPYGEPVTINYDEIGPTSIRTQTRGVWRLPANAEEVNRGGVHFVKIDSRTLFQFEDADEVKRIYEANMAAIGGAIRQGRESYTP